MAEEKMVKIVWSTIWGQECETTVPYSQVDSWKEHLCSLPDVKPETVETKKEEKKI